MLSAWVSMGQHVVSMLSALISMDQHGSAWISMGQHVVNKCQHVVSMLVVSMLSATLSAGQHVVSMLSASDVHSEGGLAVVVVQVETLETDEAVIQNPFGEVGRFVVKHRAHRQLNSRVGTIEGARGKPLSNLGQIKSSYKVRATEYRSHKEQQQLCPASLHVHFLFIIRIQRPTTQKIRERDSQEAPPPRARHPNPERRARGRAAPAMRRTHSAQPAAA
jgi:hypothetical protein